jgi:serine/threonine/tyrosine-interacting protein
MFAMQHYNLSWEDALHMVQNRRYCISPNGGFLTQIKVRNPSVSSRQVVNEALIFCPQEYESIYKAKNAVAAYPMTQRQVSRRKREDDDEDDGRSVSPILTPSQLNHVFQR